MSLRCRVFGHKTPYFFISCLLGNSFRYERDYCRRCHQHIGEYDQLYQKMYTSFGERFVWVHIDNKPVDLETHANNPRWYIPIVYDPSSEEFKGYNKGGGYETKKILHLIEKGVFVNPTPEQIRRIIYEINHGLNVHEVTH